MQGGNQVAYMDFYPRPPRGGRHHADMLRLELYQISIHALREEGDSITVLVLGFQRYFYPRPPRGGRLDGDDWYFVVDAISIHALREEGDRTLHRPSRPFPLFCPRPPREGHPPASRPARRIHGFLSTPSARRATSAYEQILAQ